MRAFTFLIAAIPFLFSFSTVVSAEVIVHDAVTIEGKEIMLTVETRGKLFSKGGEVVEFFVNGKSLGKNLSGGDGIAFRQFKPSKTGLYRISVKSGGEEDKGILLSLRKRDGILFVDVEGTLSEGGLSDRPKKGAQETIKKLSGRVPVVFLQTGLIGIKGTKEWLRENGFIDSPVVPWRQGMIFSELKEKGLKIKAVVGSARVIESARSFKPKLFSFVEVEDAEEVKDWEEIGKRLR